MGMRPRPPYAMAAAHCHEHHAHISQRGPPLPYLRAPMLAIIRGRHRSHSGMEIVTRPPLLLAAPHKPGMAPPAA
jgi:hypothetical protein